MIQIENLEKNYGDFSLQLSMEVPEGTVTGLIGKNGAGKSTTIKSLLGLVKPDSGTVRVFGKDSRSLTGADKEDFGTALAEAGFHSAMTPEDVLHILKKMYRSFDEAFFREQCKRQRLPMKQKIKEFSSGMKAKLRVLVAISHKAKLLILDEPTAGLDVLARNEILDMLREYLEEDPQRSILISSHISTDLESLCDDIYMIDNGKLVLHEDTDSILGCYGIVKVSESEYESLDKQYLKKTKKESFGYSCLTGEKQYYLENYPNMVIENCNLDSLIVMMLS